MTDREDSKQRIIKAVLLSLLDYTVIQIGVNDVARQAVYWGSVQLTWIFSSPASIDTVILWAGLLLLRLKSPEKEQKLHVYEWIIAALLALTMLMGNSVKISNSFVLLTANRSCVLLAIISWVGYTLLLINLLRWLKLLARKISESKLQLPKLWSKHPLLFPFAVIFLLWLPLAILKYPGGIDFDSYYQILQYFGYQQLNNHNPLLSTLIYGGAVKLGGQLFGSNNAGLFCAVLVQMLICAFSLAYSVKALKVLGAKPIFMYMSLGIYSVATIISRYTSSISKDGLFVCVAVMYISMLAELIMTEQRAWKIALFVLTALVMTMLRGSSAPLLAMSLVVLIINWLINKKSGLGNAIIGTALAYALCIAYSNLLLPAIGITGTPAGEALSLPLMQTARYVTYYGDEVTEEERAAIDAVVEYDELAENYMEKLSDYVKGSYRGDSKALKNYFIVWAKMGLKHPEVYLSATFNNIYGYFCPGVNEDSMGIYMQYDPVADALIQLFTLEENQAESRSDRLDKLTDFILAFESFPLFYPVCSIAVHNWLLFYLVLTAVSKKQSSILQILIPSLGCALALFDMPTFFHNGLRYGLLVIFANPFLFSVYMTKKYEEENDHAV